MLQVIMLLFGHTYLLAIVMLRMPYAVLTGMPELLIGKGSQVIIFMQLKCT